jgi:hypothetical protein
LPAGGAILTVRNLERLGELTAKTARRLLILLVLVFAVGLAILVYVAQKDKTGHFVIDSQALLVISVGVAVACYLAQGAAYRTWRTAHPTEQAGSVLEAVALTLIYYLLTAAAAAPLIVIAAALSGGNLGMQ